MRENAIIKMRVIGIITVATVMIFSMICFHSVVI